MSNPWYPPGFDERLLDGPVELDWIIERNSIRYRYVTLDTTMRLIVTVDGEEVYKEDFGSEEELKTKGMALAEKAVERYLEDMLSSAEQVD